MSFTKQQEKDYIENRGTKCPFCGGSDISSDHKDMTTGGPDELFPTVTCENPDCGKQWLEIYVLKGIEEIAS